MKRLDDFLNHLATGSDLQAACLLLGFMAFTIFAATGATWIMQISELVYDLRKASGIAN